MKMITKARIEAYEKRKNCEACIVSEGYCTFTKGLAPC